MKALKYPRGGLFRGFLNWLSAEASVSGHDTEVQDVEDLYGPGPKIVLSNEAFDAFWNSIENPRPPSKKMLEAARDLKENGLSW